MARTGRPQERVLTLGETEREELGPRAFAVCASRACLAASLYKKGVTATYHVVGPWNASILPLGSIAALRVLRILDHWETTRIGTAAGFDHSPNRPWVLASGAFDGFPTGSCAEIGLEEAAIV
jgi:hypothetical protein